MAPRKTSKRRRRPKKKKREKRYLLYCADTWEVCDEFSIIFEELVTNYQLTPVKMEVEDVQESNSVHAAVKNETLSCNSSSLSDVEQVEGYGLVCDAEPQTKKKHQCEYCKKVCPSPSKLLVHMRFHTGEKPFACETCSKTFSQRGDLVKHIRTHTGDQHKPFACEICNKTFFV